MIKLKISVDIASDKWKKAFPKMKAKIEMAAACAFLNAKKPAAFKKRQFDISIILTDDKNVKVLNKNYRGKNTPTNVLSFPLINLEKFKSSTLDIFPAKNHIPLGDVVLAFQTVKREAKVEAKTIESHTLHLVIHGVLHLLGYDHMRLKDAKIMEKLECDILESLGYADPYHENPVKKVSR